MATIAQIVGQIRTAIFGRDVRENIAQGIEKCYDDVTTGATVADAAAENANTKAGLANDAATLANTKAGLADAAATAANTAAAAAENVNASVSKSGNTVTFSVTNRNSVTSTADLSMEGSIDDTKGIGDTDYVWSADQNEKLYEAQDDRTNELYGLVNYGYDECDQIKATNTYAYSCKRNKTIYTLNGTNGSNYDGRIKINNDMARAVTGSAVKALTGGTTLIAGHEYLIRLKKILGSYTYVNAIVPTVSAYRQGESTSVGKYHIINTIGESIRTFVAEENIEYMFCIYFPSGGTATDFVCSITIEDLSVEAANKTPVTKAPVIDKVINTSSDVQTFTDGADNMPMNIEVGLSHLQDLHGYNTPWIGGMGKNLFSGFKSKSNAVVISNNIPVDFSTNTYHIFSGLTDEINCYAHAFEADGTFVGRNTGAKRSTMTLQKTSFSSGGGSQNYDSIAYIQLRYYSVPSSWGVDDADELPTQLEVGDTATAYEPYENICPITGHTASKIYHTGKNLFAKKYAEWVNEKTISSEGEIIDNSSYRYSDRYFLINGGVNIVAQATVVTAINLGTLLVEYDENKNFIRRDSFVGATGQTTGDKVVTIITDANCRYFRMITPRVTPPSNIMISYGTTASDYESNSNVYDITFPTSAGTIYNGTLTVDKDGTGTLVSDWYCYSFDGTEDISASSSGVNRFMSYNVKDVLPNPRSTTHNTRNSETKSSHFSVITANSSTTSFGMGIYYSSSILYIGTRTPDIVAGQTAEEYCAYLAEQYANGTPVTIIYKVAEPVVYYLSAPQVRTLLGFNNLWCNNASQVINSITYPSDTKTYIDNQIGADGMIAQTEASITATEAHSVGDVFICNNKLYIATAEIAIGDTIAEGTNVKSTITIGSTEVPLNLANYIKSVLLDVNSIGLDVNYLKTKVTDPDEALSKTLYIQNGSLTYSNCTVKLKDGSINFTVPNSSGANYRSIWITGTALAGSGDNMTNSKPPVDNAVPISKLASANTVRLHYDNISGTGYLYIAIAYCTVDEETVTLVGDKQGFSANTAKDYVANLVIPETATHYAIQVYQTTAAACEWNAYLQFKKVVEEESATGVSF